MHRLPTLERLMKEALIEIAASREFTDCIFWPYGSTKDGYGKMSLNGRTIRVHREVCELVHGPAPSNKPMALHKCGHSNCISGDCLYWGDAQDNANDRIRHGTNLSGESCGTSKLTWANVREIRRLYAMGRLIQEELGDRFGTHLTNIGCIVRDETWVES